MRFLPLVDVVVGRSRSGEAAPAGPGSCPVPRRGPRPGTTAGKRRAVKRAFVAALAASALAAAWRAPAQCTGYLVPREASLWMDGEKDEPRLGQRAEYVPSVAKRALNPGAGVNLEKGFHLNWLGGCRPEDSEHSKKSKRVRLVLLEGSTEEFEEAWALPAELIAFKYEFPGSDQEGPENLAAIRKAADRAIGELRAKEFKRPEVENQRTFRASFDAAWRGLMESMAAQKWQVDRIDEKSGLVTTKPAEDRWEPAMACATKYEGRSTALMSVFAAKAAGGLRVTVNVTFVAMRGHDVVACYSNGLLEKRLLDGIAKSLAAAVPAR